MPTYTKETFISDDDPTIIAGLFDWQSSSVEPAFVYAGEMPDLAAPIHYLFGENPWR